MKILKQKIRKARSKQSKFRYVVKIRYKANFRYIAKLAKFRFRYVAKFRFRYIAKFHFRYVTKFRYVAKISLSLCGLIFGALCTILSFMIYIYIIKKKFIFIFIFLKKKKFCS